MNIILIIIILVITSYLFYYKKNIEPITNTTNNLENTSSYSNTNDNTYLSYIPIKINYNNNLYNLIGKAVNKLYNQEFYLYQSKVDQVGDLFMRNNLDYLNNQIFDYIFVHFIDNKIKIKYRFGPRNKINNGDTIYLDIKNSNKRISYIGPFIII